MINSWHEVAVAYYLEGHSFQETLLFLRQTTHVSDRSLRRLLKDRNLNRNKSEAQKFKRFDCICKICSDHYKGRTPTSIMCDKCVGGSIGFTKERQQKYSYYRRITSYGLDVLTYENILDKQAGLCGLCQNKMKSPCVDHDHITGQVRGLLCNQCNLTLGQVELLGRFDWLKRAKCWIQRDKSCYGN